LRFELAVLSGFFVGARESNKTVSAPSYYQAVVLPETAISDSFIKFINAVSSEEFTLGVRIDAISPD